MLEEAAKGLLVGPRAAGARREGEDVARLVEHDDGAHRGRLALRGGEPALGELREVRRIRDGDDDVVLLDDLLVEAVGLLARQIERGLEDRLLA
jgi:hypothetical protein